jgi:hypothetical protein
MFTKDEFKIRVVEFFDEKPRDWFKDYRIEFDYDASQLKLKWEVGGATGGNCWGGEASGYSTGVVAPDFEPLYALLEEVTPNATFLSVKRLFKSVFSGTEDGPREYYGNYTEYGYKSILVSDIYDWYVACVSPS